MLIVALGWSLLEAILKSKTEHVMETATTEDLQSTKHSSKCTFTPLGGKGHSTSRKTNYLSGNFSLGGTASTGMTVSDKKNCLLEDLGNSFGRVQMHPLAWCWRVSAKEDDLFPSTGGGCEGSFWYTPATFLSCNPRDRHMMHFSLTGLALWENMKLCWDFLSSCCAWHRQQNVFRVIIVSQLRLWTCKDTRPRQKETVSATPYSTLHRLFNVSTLVIHHALTMCYKSGCCLDVT